MMTSTGIGARWRHCCEHQGKRIILSSIAVGSGAKGSGHSPALMCSHMRNVSVAKSPFGVRFSQLQVPSRKPCGAAGVLSQQCCSCQPHQHIVIIQAMTSAGCCCSTKLETSSAPTKAESQASHSKRAACMVDQSICTRNTTCTPAAWCGRAAKIKPWPVQQRCSLPFKGGG